MNHLRMAFVVALALTTAACDCTTGGNDGGVGGGTGGGSSTGGGSGGGVGGGSGGGSSVGGGSGGGAGGGTGGGADGGRCPGPGGFACNVSTDCCAGQFCRDEGPDSGVAKYCSACKGGGPAMFAGPCSQGEESCAADLDCSPSLQCNVPTGLSVGACTGPSQAVPSCQTLVLAFLGCDEARLQECEREYAAVHWMPEEYVDNAAMCLRANFASVADAGWPDGGTCSVTAVPPLLSASSQWFHGICQSDNGSAQTAVNADTNFPSCGDAGEPQCFFGPDNSGASL